MMAGLFMPNGVDPMCHGNYVGDATACECEDATKNDDGSDGALRTTLGYAPEPQFTDPSRVTGQALAQIGSKFASSKARKPSIPL